MAEWISKDKSKSYYGQAVTTNKYGKVVPVSQVAKSEAMTITTSKNSKGQTVYTTPSGTQTTNEAQAVNETLTGAGVKAPTTEAPAQKGMTADNNPIMDAYREKFKPWAGTSSTQYGEVNLEGQQVKTPEQLGYTEQPQASWVERTKYNIMGFPQRVKDFPYNLKQSVAASGGVIPFGIQTGKEVGNIIMTPVRGAGKALSSGFYAMHPGTAEPGQSWLEKWGAQQSSQQDIIGTTFRARDTVMNPLDIKGKPLMTDPDVQMTAVVGGLALLPEGSPFLLGAAGAYAGVSTVELISEPSPRSVANVGVSALAFGYSYKQSNLPRLEVERFNVPSGTKQESILVIGKGKGLKPSITEDIINVPQRKTLGYELALVSERSKTPEGMVKPLLSVNTEGRPGIQPFRNLEVKGEYPIGLGETITPIKDIGGRDVLQVDIGADTKWQGRNRITEEIVATNFEKLATKPATNLVEVTPGSGEPLSISVQDQATLFREGVYATRLFRNQKSVISESLLKSGTKYLGSEDVGFILDVGREYGATTYGSKGSASHNIFTKITTKEGKEIPVNIKLSRTPKDIDQFFSTPDVKVWEQATSNIKLGLEETGKSVRFGEEIPTKTSLELFTPTEGWVKVYEAHGRGELGINAVPDKAWGYDLGIAKDAELSPSGYKVARLSGSQQRKFTESSYFEAGALSVRSTERMEKGVPDFLRETAWLSQYAKDRPSTRYPAGSIDRVQNFLGTWPEKVGIKLPAESITVELGGGRTPSPGLRVVDFGRARVSPAPRNAPSRYSLMPSPKSSAISQALSPTPSKYSPKITYAPPYSPAKYKPEPYTPSYTPPYTPPYTPSYTPPYSPKYTPSYTPPYRYQPSPSPPLMSIPGLGLNDQLWQRKKGKRVKFTPSYFASIEATAFGIKGKMPSAGELATGLGLRPIVGG
jgi:hypothetical protein